MALTATYRGLLWIVLCILGVLLFSHRELVITQLQPMPTFVLQQVDLAASLEDARKEIAALKKLLSAESLRKDMKGQQDGAVVQDPESSHDEAQDTEALGEGEDIKGEQQNIANTRAEVLSTTSAMTESLSLMEETKEVEVVERLKKPKRAKPKKNQEANEDLNQTQEESTLNGKGGQSSWEWDPQLDSLGDEPEYFGESSAPIIRPVCDKREGSTKKSACMEDPLLEYNAVVDYPPWVISMPNFVSEEDRAWFEVRAFGPGNFQKLGFNAGDERRCPMELHACRKFFDPDAPFPPEKYLVIWYYPFVQGRHIVAANATYKGGEKCRRWVSDQESSTFLQPPIRQPDFDELTLLMTQEGATFQHFLDHTLLKLSHGWELLDPRTHPDMKLLTPLSGRDTLMHEILERLGFPLEKLDTVFSATAAHFVYPCHSPLRHPYLWQRVRRMLGVQREEGAPKKIIYFSREGTSVHNPGRNVLNERKLLQAITQWLEDEGREEELVLFDHKKLKGLDDYLSFFKDARVVLGPHGGAFYNLLFAPPKTLVIEFFPARRFDQHVALASFWMLARSIDGKYYLLPRAPSHKAIHDMTVDIDAVLGILKEELNKA